MLQFAYLALDVPLFKSKIQRFQTKSIKKRVIGARGVLVDLGYSSYDLRYIEWSGFSSKWSGCTN